MEILAKRKTYTANSTISHVSVNDVDICLAIEPPEVPNEKGLKCVPCARYRVLLRQDGNVWLWMMKSCPDIGLEHGIPWIQNILGQEYPIWHNKPGIQPEDYVLSHIGNFENPVENDSEGCLCTGMTQSVDEVDGSKEAFCKFYPLIRDSILSGEEVFITYVDAC